MVMPFVISVPHGGEQVPDWLADNFKLKHVDLIADGDEQSFGIYRALQPEVALYHEEKIARAVLDLNRETDDFRADGITKTETCWQVPIWHKHLTDQQSRRLIDEIYTPYHQKLSDAAKYGVIMGFDCHTMAAVAPPSAPDVGKARPQVCIGDLNGKSCSAAWSKIILDCFQAYFPGEVTLNRPFSGGQITRRHSAEMPWVQIEISRADFAKEEMKSLWTLLAIRQIASMITHSIAS